MARARSGKNKRRAKRSASKGRGKAPAKKRAARRRRAPRVKARSGPVQLWLPLQMPLGLLGGHAVQQPAGVVDEPLALQPAVPDPLGEQSSLFD